MIPNKLINLKINQWVEMLGFATAQYQPTKVNQNKRIKYPIPQNSLITANQRYGFFQGETGLQINYL